MELHRFLKLAAIRKVSINILARDRGEIRATLIEKEYSSVREVLDTFGQNYMATREHAKQVLEELNLLFVLNRDGRALDPRTLEEIRILAVQRVEAVENPEDVIRTLGSGRSVIYPWLATYREGGIDALRAKAISGRPPKMTGKQLKWVYKTVTGKNPLQLRFEFALWTRSMIRELIRERFGVRLSEVSAGRMLRKLGLSPQIALRSRERSRPRRHHSA